MTNGIYFGFCYLDQIKYYCVLSIGFNPYYNNLSKTIEVHIIHIFE